MTLGTEIINRILKREHPSDTLPLIATINENLFYLEDTKKGSYIGSCFIGYPLSGINQSTLNSLKSVISQGFPADTILQFNLVSTSHVTKEIERLYNERVALTTSSRIIDDDQRATFLEFAKIQHEALLKGRTHSPIQLTNVPIKSNRLLVSIKFPYNVKPSERDIFHAEEYSIKLQEGFKSAGLYLDRLNHKEYLAQLRAIIYPFEEYDYSYEEDRLLRHQVFSPGEVINNINSRTLGIGDTKFKFLSVKRLPRQTSIPYMNLLVGDPDGLIKQISTPFMLSLIVEYLDQDKARGNIQKNQTWISHQATPGLLRVSPKLRETKRGFDILINDAESGAITRTTLTMCLMSESEETLQRIAAQLPTEYDSFGLKVKEDTQILWPLFYNCLPLLPSPESLKNLSRHRTLNTTHVAQFLPIFSDWTGSSTKAVQLYLTRRGNLFPLDIYNTTTNYNGAIWGGSGGGKSFFAQSFVLNELMYGAKVWVVDEGDSYKKLANSIGGEYIYFSPTSKVCLNPFTHVQDIDDEVNMLTLFIEKMAAPTQGFDDFERPQVDAAIKAVWSTKANMMTVTDVQQYLYNQNDQRCVDIASQLYPFTRTGQFGSWFEGANNLEFHKNFVVLELGGLRQQPHMKTVVMMLLASRIKYEMYKFKLSRKIVLFDEAKDHIMDPVTSRFLDDAFARYRKENGSAWIISQSLSATSAAPGFQALSSNMTWRIFLKQEDSEVNKLIDAKQIGDDTYLHQQMKSLKILPGQFSEAMILGPENSSAVVRLALPRFFNVLFSTKGDERNEIFDQMEKGVPVVQAINEFINKENEKKNHDRF